MPFSMSYRVAEVFACVCEALLCCGGFVFVVVVTKTSLWSCAESCWSLWMCVEAGRNCGAWKIVAEVAGLLAAIFNFHQGVNEQLFFYVGNEQLKKNVC